MASAAYQKIKETDALPSPTGTALEILHLARDEQTPLSRLEAVIEKDPAIASRLLRFVNSPFVGMPRRIGSISQAVVLLGLQTVKAVSLGFSLISGNQDGPCRNFDYEGFWSGSVATAAAARRIARMVQSLPMDEAFTGGLLCQIGRLAFATAFPEAYAHAIELAEPQGAPTLAETEREMFEIDHSALAAEMMTDWSLPEDIIEAVRLQDSPDRLDLVPGSSQASFVGTLHLARSVSVIFTRPSMPRQSLISADRSAHRLGIRPDIFPAVFDTAAIDWRQAGKVFGVPTRRVLSWGEVYAHAT